VFGTTKTTCKTQYFRSLYKALECELYKVSNVDTEWWVGGGGGLPYEKVGYTFRKIWIKPLKKINLGVAQALFDPWKIPLKTE